MRYNKPTAEDPLEDLDMDLGEDSSIAEPLDDGLEEDLDDDIDSKGNSKELKEDLSDDGYSNDDDLFAEDIGMGNDFGWGGVPPREKHQDLLRDLTNFDSYIREKINGWLGLVWSEEKQTFVTSPNIEPVMNARCAAWCIDLLRNYARKNNIITHIGKQEYIFLIEDIIHMVWLNLSTRSEDFGIKNLGDVLKICTEIEHVAALVLMGAGDGKYNDLLSTTTQRSEAISAQMRPEQITQMGQIAQRPPSLRQKLTNFLGGK